MASLSIGILTMNEERRIAACLASAAFADEVVVVDSGSTDNTHAMVQAQGAALHVHADWQGFAEQRNRLLSHTHGDWIFFLDADEVITPELAAELRRIVNADVPCVGEIHWEQMAFGQSLGRMRNTSGVPRLFARAQLLRFEGAVHEGPVLRDPQLPVQRLQHRLLHYSRETIYGSLLKMAQYVQLGAYKRLQAGKRGGVLRGAASGLANFIRMYFFQCGFLCGRAGFLHCLLLSLECFFRYVALEVDRPFLTQAQKR